MISPTQRERHPCPQRDSNPLTQQTIKNKKSAEKSQACYRLTPPNHHFGCLSLKNIKFSGVYEQRTTCLLLSVVGHTPLFAEGCCIEIHFEPFFRSLCGKRWTSKYAPPPHTQTHTYICFKSLLLLLKDPTPIEISPWVLPLRGIVVFSVNSVGLSKQNFFTFYWRSYKHNSGFARLSRGQINYFFFRTQLYRSCTLVFIIYYFMVRLSVSATFRYEYWFTKKSKREEISPYKHLV